MISRLSLVCGLGLLVATGRAGAAPSDREEEALIRHGIELRKAQDDMTARAEFQKAYDLTHSPRAAAQVGLAEFALGRWDDAEAHVSEALRTPKDPWIAKYRLELDRSLATIKTHVARVEVMGEPAGAEVYVNGRLAGQLPLAAPVSVSEGQVDVDLRARGFARANRTVTVSGGQYQRLVIRLEREASAVGGVPASTSASAPGPAAVVKPAGAVAVAAAASASATIAAEPSAATKPARGANPAAAGMGGTLAKDAESGPSTGRLVAKWTSLGLTGAALAVGISATVIHENNISIFGRLHGGGCFDNGGRAVDASGDPVTDCQPSLDTYRSARTWQIVGFAAAGVFAAAWLVLTLTEPAPGGTNGRTTDRPIAAWVCAPTLSATGGTCAMRF